jgi:hypothetical protein
MFIFNATIKVQKMFSNIPSHKGTEAQMKKQLTHIGGDSHE